MTISCARGAEVARQSHKLEVEGSNPSAATISSPASQPVTSTAVPASLGAAVVLSGGE